MNILITGGAGFIGTHLTKRLLNEGHRVICIDNLQTGSEANIQQFYKNNNFKAVFKDIKLFDYQDMKNIGPVHRIYNLACPASPKAYQAKPIDTTLTCVLGLMKMLMLAKNYNCRILQASTSEIYGNALEHPQKETYLGNVNPIGIRSCYDEGKRCAESLLFDAHRMGQDVRLVRIFNTYGPYMDKADGRVVSNFILQALKGEPITVYGDGKQTRSFCYVDDLVNGLILAMEGKQIGPFNLGNPGEFTINELANLVIKKTNSKSEIVYKPLPSDDPIQRRPDITKAQQVLGYEPKIKLDEGLDKTIEYFRRLL